MKIYLIRHGESTSDVKQKYDGDYDDHLTEQGMREAHVIAKYLQKSDVEIIFSSQKIRARETSKVICDEIGCITAVVNGFAEQNIYSAFLDLGKDQPEEEYRKLGEILVNRDNAVDGAETYADFKDRIIAAFSKIAYGRYEAVAIVTHGGPIRCLFREVFQLGEFKSICNGAIIELKGNGLDFKVAKLIRAELNGVKL